MRAIEATGREKGWLESVRTQLHLRLFEEAVPASQWAAIIDSVQLVPGRGKKLTAVFVIDGKTREVEVRVP